MSDKKKSAIMMGLLAISIFAILIGMFSEFEQDDIAINKFLIGLGVGLQLIILSRMFWFRHYVQWTKEGMMIRIKSFLGTSFQFDDVQNINFETDRLQITKTNGKILLINLSGIRESDSLKLKEILTRNKVPQ
jgi:hypothetical protein